jgi:hypothetical protein
MKCSCGYEKRPDEKTKADFRSVIISLYLPSETHMQLYICPACGTVKAQ